MGHTSTCENASITTYYLLLPLLIIALLTLFIIHEHRWGGTYTSRIYQHVPLEHKPITLSSLSTKKRRMKVKDEKEEYGGEHVEYHKDGQKEMMIDGDGKKSEEVIFTDVKKPSTVPTRITLVDESGTPSIFPIPSTDTTFHDVLSLYASTHHLPIDHLMLMHNNVTIPLESTLTTYGIHDTDTIHIIPHYKNILEYKRTTWNNNKNQLETKIAKLRADLMIVEDVVQQRASQLTDLQSRYDTIFKELSHLKSTSHMSEQHSPVLEGMNGDVEMWKEKVATLEKELIEALKWKTQCKTLEREAKEAQRWKSVVKQGRLREKSLERDVKEMHHWRQRARAFEKEVKELRIFKRYMISRYGDEIKRYGIETQRYGDDTTRSQRYGDDTTRSQQYNGDEIRSQRYGDETSRSQTMSRYGVDEISRGNDTTPPRINDMTLRMTSTPPMTTRTPPTMTPLNVHTIQQQQQQQQQQQHVIQHTLHTRMLQQQYPNLLHHFPTVIPTHTSSQSVPVTARGISTSTSTSTSTSQTSPPIQQSIIGIQHSRRLTIGSSTSHIPSSVTWTPSLSTPLFDLSDSTPSSTVTSPQLDAHEPITIPSPLMNSHPIPSHTDNHDDVDYMNNHLISSHIDNHDDVDYISGLVLNDDGYSSDAEQLPLNLSSDDGSENERIGEEEA